MILFAMARSATTMLRAASASIFSCAAIAVAVAASSAAVVAAICARRAVSSSGSILRNVALVVTILTLVDEVFLFWICKFSEGVLAWLYNLRINRMSEGCLVMILILVECCV